MSRPNPDDGTVLLQGKTLRFIGEGKYKEALEGIAIIRERTSSYEGGRTANDFPTAALAALERTAQLGTAAPFAGGVLVVGFEPPATSHKILKAGDIVTAIDGEHVASFDGYSAKSAPGKTYTVYRLDAKGGFVKLELTMPPDQPRVGLVGFGK